MSTTAVVEHFYFLQKVGPITRFLDASPFDWILPDHPLTNYRHASRYRLYLERALPRCLFALEDLVIIILTERESMVAVITATECDHISSFPNGSRSF